MEGAPAAKKEKKEKFVSHKNVKIIAACGVHEGEWDQVSPIYKNITKDGRTHSASRDAKELEYRSITMIYKFYFSVFLLTQLVLNVKYLNLGWQGRSTFGTCHRGILSFSMPPRAQSKSIDDSGPWRRANN